MRNSKLIDQLTSDLKAVRPFSPLRNTLIWLGVSLVCVAVMLMMMPLRQVSQMTSPPMFIISGLWFLVSSILLAFATNTLGLPGRSNQRLVLSVSFAIYLLLIGVLLGAAISGHSPVVLNGTNCIVAVVMLSVVPFLFFLSLLRKLAPTLPWMVGLLLGLSTCTLGAFGIGFSCASDDPLHLLIFHFLTPALLVGGLGAFFGNKILKW